MKFLISIAFLFFIGCSSHSDSNVIAIAKTNSYHRDFCGRVNMAKTVEMPQIVAESLHYNPCPLCMK